MDRRKKTSRPAEPFIVNHFDFPTKEEIPRDFTGVAYVGKAIDIYFFIEGVEVPVNQFNGWVDFNTSIAPYHPCRKAEYHILMGTTIPTGKCSTSVMTQHCFTAKCQ